MSSYFVGDGRLLGSLGHTCSLLPRTALPGSRAGAQACENQPPSHLYPVHHHAVYLRTQVKQALQSHRARESPGWDRQAGAAECEGVYEFSIAAVTTRHKCGDTASLTAPEVRQSVSPGCVTVQQGRPPSWQLSGTTHCQLIQVAEFSSTGL